MSSDDSDFNPDALEALSAKEEYDSEPSTTSDDDSSVEGSGSDAERKREEKRKRKQVGLKGFYVGKKLGIIL